MASLEDRYRALEQLSLMALGDEMIPTFEQHLIEHRKMVGRFQGLDAVYERKFVVALMQKVMDDPAAAARLLRELIAEKLVNGPYPTSRKGRYMDVVHLPYEKLTAAKDKADEELPDDFE